MNVKICSSIECPFPYGENNTNFYEVLLEFNISGYKTSTVAFVRHGF